MKKNYILFIDSGIGGLSTLSFSIKLTNFNYIFFADNQFAPYGNLTQKFLQTRLKNILNSFFKVYDIKIIVLACNTATTSSINFLRKTFPSKTFVGTEPAIQLALKQNLKNPAVIATKQTIKQLKLKNIKNTKLIATKNLATTIENYFFSKTLVNYFKLIKEIYLIKHVTMNNDTIILGCTHYCLIIDLIKKIIEKPIIDGNFGVSKRINSLLTDNKIKKSTISIKLSRQNNKLKQKYKKILWQILAKQNIL